MTGLPAIRHRVTTSFCTPGTSSCGICAPRSPRATMTASDASTIASRLGTASHDSILAITSMPLPALDAR